MQGFSHLKKAAGRPKKNEVLGMATTTQKESPLKKRESVTKKERLSTNKPGGNPPKRRVTKSRTFNEAELQQCNLSSGGSSSSSSSDDDDDADDTFDGEGKHLKKELKNSDSESEFLHDQKKKIARRSTIVSKPIFDSQGKIVDFMIEKKARDRKISDESDGGALSLTNKSNSSCLN